MAEIYKSTFSGQEIDERLELIPELQEGVEAAQQAVDGKYTKPASGIPMDDLSDEVQEAIEEGGGQADWAQTDTTAPDYIKNKPSIPTHVVRFDQQFLSASEQMQARANIGAGTYSKPTAGIPAEDLADDVIPDVSDFITNTVNNLVNYYLKSETYSRSEVQQLIAAIQGVSFVSVASLPTPSADTMGGKIYLVPSTNPDEQNVKDEYITIQDGSTYAWEQIGSTKVNLSGYVTLQQLNTALAAYTTTEALTTLLAAKQDTISDLSAIRSGAAAGATAYQKPQTGIPASDLASGVIPTDVVKYSSQSLTDAQKTQARTNIGAAAAAALTALETAIAAKYTKPSSGIPETDLAANVQSALALARTSIQSLADYYDKTEIDSLLAAVSSEQYVDVATLPTASADTLGKIYLVGPTNGVYDRYYTSYDGTTYSWVGVGTTEINLANYATKAELSQLSQEVDEIKGDTTIDVTGAGSWQVGRVFTEGFFPSYTGYHYQRFNAKKGDTINYSGYADSSTIVFGIVVASNSITAITKGAGTSSAAAGQYIVLEDAEFVICGYNNMTETVSIARTGIIPEMDERLEDVEERTKSYSVNLLEGVSWQVGRVLDDGYPLSSYTSYHYAIIPNVRKGDVIQYEGKADSATTLFGYAKPGIASFTRVAIGAGTADPVSGTFEAPYDCSILICTYNNVNSSLTKLVPSIDVRVANVEDLEPEITSIRDDLGSKTENAIEYTVTNGQYINKNGVVTTFGNALLTQPIYLQKDTVIRLTGVAPSTCAPICRTDSSGSSYIPLVIGKDVQYGAFLIEYRIPETGYYAFSSTQQTLDIKRLSFSGALLMIDQLTETVGNYNADGGNILAAFDNLVCVGDSLTWSMVYYGNGVSDQRQAKRTYPEVLASLCGNEFQILATAGDTAKRCWDTQKNNISAKENPLAIIYLGTNEGLTDSLDTDVIGDDPDNWADNNTGCYCRFVQRFQSLGYKVLLLKCWATNRDLEETNTTIEHIATHFNCAVMDVPYTSATQYHYYPDLSGLNGVHYNDLGYAWFASMLIKESGKLPSDQLRLLIPNAS